MQSKFYPTSFNCGDRVRTLGFSPENQSATFIEYGPANVACPDTHLSTPGMRIAYVNSDRFGRIPVWERDVVAVDPWGSDPDRTTRNWCPDGR